MWKQNRWNASLPKNQNIKQKQYCNKFHKDFKNGPHQKKKILKKKKCSLVRYLYKILHMISWPPFEAVWCTSTNKDLEKSYSREVLFSCLIHHFSNLFDHRKYYYGTTLRTDLGKCSFLFFSFFFLAVLHGMWDLSSPTRYWTHAPCIGSAEF